METAARPRLAPSPPPPAPSTEGPRLLAGLGLGYLLLQGAAAALGSTRGEAGLLVGALVVAALLGVEGVLFHRPPRAAARALGLGRPAWRGLLVAAGLGALLLLVLPAFVRRTGASYAMYPGWGGLLPGLFAQAGIAEETLFRGYLFGHLRRGRSFGRAAVLAAGPFVVVHLTMFATLPWPVALAAVLLAVAMSFPLAYLYELGGDTVWGPALLHTVVQGALKVVVVAGAPALPLVWIAASAVVPLLAFAVPRAPRNPPAAVA